MINRSRIYHRGEVQRFKRALLQVPGWSLRELLPNDVLHRLIERASCIRDTIYTPLVTLGLFIRQVLGDDASCKNVVAGFRTERLCAGKDAVSMNTGPYCKARYRLALEPLQELVRKSGEAAVRHETTDSQWFGWQVKIVDGATVQLQDTPENQATYPQPTHQEPGIGFPIIRLVALISLSKATVLDYALDAYAGKGTGEASLFARLLGGLGSGDLLLGDRYYASYGILASLVERGAAGVMKQHGNRKTDFRCGKKLGARDHIVCWRKPKDKPVWMADETFAALPAELRLREFRVAGVVYVTTLLDAKKYPKKELGNLYQKRWNIELDIRSIKTHMGMEMLRCLTPAMVEKEIAVNLLAYNLIRAQIGIAAHLHDRLPRQLSFKAGVQLFLNAVAQWKFVASRRLKVLIADLLLAMASTAVGGIKKKSQPRVLKRRPKGYPLMMQPRDVLCEALKW